MEAKTAKFDGKKADNPHRGRRQGNPATFASGAKFSLCGVFLYKSEQVAPADPSCKKMPPAPAHRPAG